MNCTGNCNQGRACDCAPDCPEMDPDDNDRGVSLIVWALYTLAMAEVFAFAGLLCGVLS